MNESMICESFGICGGCMYADISYEDELNLKEGTVRDLLKDIQVETFEGIIPSPSATAYRNKMELAFGDECKGGKLALGIRKRRNYYEVVTPVSCTIIPDDFKAILTTVLDYFRNTQETFFHRKLHKGSLRHLTLRRGEFTGEVLINLVTSSQLRTSLEPMQEQLLNLKLNGKIVGILHTINDGLADTVKNENVHILWGRDYFYENLCGLTFKVSAFSFLQTNSAGAECLYQKVRDYAGCGGMMYDLYCGTGTIAQIVSKNAQQVIGVELVEEAIHAANENKQLNDITNCTFMTGDVLLAADKLVTQNGKPDVIILDPPRDGLHPKSLPKLLDMEAKRIVYVSCKPSSLARDLAVFTQQGYEANKVVCVDMFPRTPHVECVVLLSKLNSSTSIEV